MPDTARFSRHLALRELGPAGQATLSTLAVAVAGTDPAVVGLAVRYLAASGVPEVQVDASLVATMRALVGPARVSTRPATVIVDATRSAAEALRSVNRILLREVSHA